MDRPTASWDLFAACAPGLEALLAAELEALGAGRVRAAAGGVEFAGDLRLVARANLALRTANRVLVRLGAFRAMHLAQLDKRARRLPWPLWLSPGQPIRVAARCRASRIYHSQAAAERVERAAREVAGARPATQGQEAAEFRVRLVDDWCTVSLDSSGPPLWQRGPEREVSAAPLRESLAAAGLLWAGWDGSRALCDPLCGSGTLALEAARLALGLAPGLERDFAFSRWPGGAEALGAERAVARAARRAAPAAGLFASDRSGGAVGMTRRNLQRAGLDSFVTVERRELAALEPPAASGLLIANPPYGRRLGRGGESEALWALLGRVFAERFRGWRLALFCPHPRLAEATGLELSPLSPPLAHGGLKVRLLASPAGG